MDLIVVMKRGYRGGVAEARARRAPKPRKILEAGKGPGSMAVPATGKEAAMRISAWAAAGMSAWLVASAGAANVYVMSSGDAALDGAVVSVLTSRGHTATVGVAFTAFDGTQNLSGFQTVYFQANANWSTGDMPVAGQQALMNWVNGGGRLVTCEWVAWLAATGRLQTLLTILPREQNSGYGAPDP